MVGIGRGWWGPPKGDHVGKLKLNAKGRALFNKPHPEKESVVNSLISQNLIKNKDISAIFGNSQYVGMLTDSDFEKLAVKHPDDALLATYANQRLAGDLLKKVALEKPDYALRYITSDRLGKDLINKLAVLAPFNALELHSSLLTQETIKIIAETFPEAILKEAPSLLEKDALTKLAYENPSIIIERPSKFAEYPDILESASRALPHDAFRYGVMDYLSDEIVQELSLEAPLQAVKWTLPKLTDETLTKLVKTSPNQIFVEEPTSALIERLSKLDKNVLKAMTKSHSLYAISFLSDYIDIDKDIIEAVALQDPEFILTKAPNKIDPKFFVDNRDKIIPKLRHNDTTVLYPNLFDDSRIRSALFYEWVNYYNGNIAQTFREVVKEEFNLKELHGGVDLSVKISGVKVEKPILHLSTDKERLKKVVRNLYDECQEKLKAEFPNKKTIKLYRGIRTKVDVPCSFNSFTPKKVTAMGFDGYDIIEIEVPFSSILSYPSMGTVSGFNKEKEWIVLGDYSKYRKYKKKETQK